MPVPSLAARTESGPACASADNGRIGLRPFGPRELAGHINLALSATMIAWVQQLRLGALGVACLTVPARFCGNGTGGAAIRARAALDAVVVDAFIIALNAAFVQDRFYCVSLGL